MSGRLIDRLSKAWIIAAVASLALSSQGHAQSWELERERGIGGGPAKVATDTAPVDLSGKNVGVSIVIEPTEEPVIRAAEGVPVSPFADEQAPAAAPDPQAVVALTQGEAAAAAALRSQRERAAAGAEIRSAPPTAAELLSAAPPTPIETTALAALPSRDAIPRPAAKPNIPVLPVATPPVATPKVLPGATEPQPSPVQQAQLAPNAGAQPNIILPPRAADAPAVMPSPRKPDETAVQPVALAPNVAAAPKESVLRTAPIPDNTLVELVETPSDYSLSVAAGTGQVLNLGKPVSNVFVADPNVADVNVLSPTQIVVHGNQLGRTNMYGMGSGGDVVFAMDVDTVPNADVARGKLQAAAPASTTDVSLDSGTLVADGAVANVGEAIEVANVVDGLQQTQGPAVNNTTITGSQQVNLRVRFAEVSRNDIFYLGVNWEALADTGDFLFGLSTGNFLSAAGTDLPARSLINGDEFARFDFTGEFGDVSVDAFIDALQREGIVNILAEPNLTSVNGEPAEFLAGGEIPILVPGGGGDGNVTIDYKPFGVSLDFIPTLLPGERINLRVRPEVSSITSNGAVVLDGFAVPAFTVRRAETSVELASGQTFAIAGLFQRDLATDTDKFPILGDVPVLGQLFRSERFKRSETELVILITPYLVKPTSSRDIALPNDRLDTPASPLTHKSRKGGGFIIN